MADSRIKNTTKNAITGLLNQVINLLLNFISRTVFIHYLGVEYLGISGLFTNILQVLSMADLGFGTAMVYSMYKPIANDDKSTLSSLMNYYRKIYNYIAVSVLVIGFILIPFLPYIVNTEKSIDHLVIYYILYLLNTVMSYLFVYKTSIAVAHQKSYILNNYDSLFIIIQNILQIIFLIYTRNFIIFLIIQIMCSFIKNLYKARKSEQMYPYIKNKGEINERTKKEIFNNVKSMFVYKVGGVLLNNTDNVIISILIGTSVVGLYSNYLIVITAINSFTNIFFNSMTASIGNLNVTSSNDESFQYFNRINFLSVCVFSFCGICFYTLINDFINLWLGNAFIFDKLTVIAITLNLVIPGTIRTVSLYRDTMGMFQDTKYIFFITSVINIILSIILGKEMGLAGVLLATSIARLLTNMWFEPLVLFKKYLKQSPIKYFRKQIGFWIIFVINLIIVQILCNIIFTNITLFSFVLKTIFVAISAIIFMIIFFRNNDEFLFYKELLLKMAKRLEK